MTSFPKHRAALERLPEAERKLFTELVDYADWADENMKVFVWDWRFGDVARYRLEMMRTLRKRAEKAEADRERHGVVRFNEGYDLATKHSDAEEDKLEERLKAAEGAVLAYWLNTPTEETVNLAKAIFDERNPGVRAR